MDELEFDPNLSVKAVHDYHLIRAALDKGDQKAYAELMGRYRDSVYFMLLKMVNNKDDADDLTIDKIKNVDNNSLNGNLLLVKSSELVPNEYNLNILLINIINI